MSDVKVCVNVKNTYYSNLFKKDLVSVEEILDKLDEIICENEELREELDDLKEDIQENYKPISAAEQIGYNERDFIEVL